MSFILSLRHQIYMYALSHFKSCVRSRKSYKNLEQKTVRRKQAEAKKEEGRKVRNKTRSQLRNSSLDPKHFTRSGMDSMAPLCPVASLSPARHPVPLFPKTRLRGWVGGWGCRTGDVVRGLELARAIKLSHVVTYPLILTPLFSKGCSFRLQTQEPRAQDRKMIPTPSKSTL